MTEKELLEKAKKDFEEFKSIFSGLDMDEIHEKVNELCLTYGAQDGYSCPYLADINFKSILCTINHKGIVSADVEIYDKDGQYYGLHSFEPIESKAYNYLDSYLVDDASSVGGKAYSDETLKDFINESYTLNFQSDMIEVNYALISCHIKPIVTCSILKKLLSYNYTDSEKEVLKTAVNVFSKDKYYTLCWYFAINNGLNDDLLSKYL